MAEANAERKWETSTTPSGTEIRFSPEPREYQILHPSDGDSPLGWLTVPSVTTILDVLNKPALPWWGMGVGVEGVQELNRIVKNFDVLEYTKEEVVALLTEYKLTVNHVKGKAADRGTSVHAALEAWYVQKTTGNISPDGNAYMPDPQFFPEEERLYVQGLVNFLTDAKLEPVASEVTVGSKSDGYAGRYDLLAYYGGEEVCTHLTPKKEKREALEPGLYLFDLKTSSGVYPGSHFRQLAAYAKASVECGYETPDDCAVINVQKDGRYMVKRSNATYEDFQCVHEVWKSDQRLKGK
jgi:hypothetical protein